MPIVMMLIAFAAGGHVAGRRAKGATKEPIELDANMPLALREWVLYALGSETDPEQLKHIGNEIAKSFPKASYELRMKAWLYGGQVGPLPTPSDAVA